MSDENTSDPRFAAGVGKMGDGSYGVEIIVGSHCATLSTVWARKYAAMILSVADSLTETGMDVPSEGAEA